MSHLNALGFGSMRLPKPGDAHSAQVMMQRPLQRVLAFRNRTIDDVVNSPFVKNEVFGYWKVLRQIDRRSEILDLEEQWNGLGMR